MPVNYPQIQQQLREKSGQAGERRAEFQRRRQQALDLLSAQAGDLDGQRQRVAQAASQDRNLRCAVPLDERLDTARPAPLVDEYPLLLAADGSQINPNRHDPVEFAVINVGLIRLAPGQPQAPQEYTATQLFIFEDLDGSQGGLTEELVALTRDLNERRELAERAAQETGGRPVLTLTDGPLELFREPKDDKRFEQRFKDYLDVLERLATMGVVTAGYVDKPRADLVVRLLELGMYPPEEMHRAGKERPLGGVRDIDLYPQLKPGERTPLFAIQSSSNERFSERMNGALGLCFFYLNAGREGHSWLARVEIPYWVSRQTGSVDLLHATLLQQARQMGARSYPYVLHRAHEIALVTFQEKQQIQLLIENELRRLGIEYGEQSHKQSGKDLQGRKRYGK